VIPALQYYRALAAILVVLYHAACVFGPTGYYPGQSWETVFLFGHAGVELFFVLSGFIICHVHYDRVNRPGELVSYIQKRLTRIYPPVFLAVAAWAAFRLAGGTPLSGMEWMVSLTLIPFEFVYAPPILWTLSFEMAFYALFLVAFLDRRLFVAATILWGASGYALFMLDRTEGVNTVFGSAYSILFSFGILAFFIVRKAPPLSLAVRLLLAAIATALFAYAACADVAIQLGDLPARAQAVQSRQFTLVFGAAGVIFVVLCADPRVRLPGRAHRLLGFLGDASFAIYLWHLFPQRILARTLDDMGLSGADARAAGFALLVITGIAAGAIVHVWIERPMIAWINGWISRFRQGRAALKH